VVARFSYVEFVGSLTVCSGPRGFAGDVDTVRLLLSTLLEKINPLFPSEEFPTKLVKFCPNASVTIIYSLQNPPSLAF
jgi:hypothetical protein